MCCSQLWLWRECAGGFNWRLEDPLLISAEIVSSGFRGDVSSVLFNLCILGLADAHFLFVACLLSTRGCVLRLPSI
jgi:hypothetical protein